GLEELWVTTNCFAPFDVFGRGPFGGYSGDGKNRKFGDGGSSRTSGRAHINLTTGGEAHFLPGSSVSTFYRHFGSDYSNRSDSKIEGKYYYASDDKNYHHIQMHIAGNNQAAIMSPDIDSHVNIYFEKNPQDKTKVLVHGY